MKELNTIPLESKWGIMSLGIELIPVFVRAIRQSGKFFDFTNKFFGRFKCRNIMFGDMYRDILFYIAADFGGSFFGYEAAKAPDINIFAFCQRIFYFFE